eukprot:1732427-Rhodomonas_salina.1
MSTPTSRGVPAGSQRHSWQTFQPPPPLNARAPPTYKYALHAQLNTHCAALTSHMHVSLAVLCRAHETLY